MKRWIAILLFGLTAQAFARPPEALNFDELNFTPPPVTRAALSCGATVFMLEDHELPLVNISVAVRTGAMYDDPARPGVAGFTAALLRIGGTKNLKPDALDEELEFLGIALGSDMDTEMGSASLSALTKDLDRGLEILSAMLFEPAFDSTKLEIEKAKTIEGIRRRNDEPYQIARREFRKKIYGPRHPLSRTLEIPEVRKISKKDLMEFHGRYWRPNNMMIAISGDFNREEMLKKLDAAFQKGVRANLSPLSFPIVATADPATLALERRVGLVEKAGNQSSVIIGHLGVKRFNPDRFALEVMNEILGGGGFSSRLMSSVRERQGLAYWVGSSFSEPWDLGTIGAGCQTRSAATGQAVRSILHEIKRMREEPVSDQELKLAKDSITNSFVFRYASAHGIALQKMTLAYYGFPEDYMDTYTRKIAAVTKQDVLRAAREYWKPDHAQIIVVGQSKSFDVDLSTFGLVTPIAVSIPE